MHPPSFALVLSIFVPWTVHAQDVPADGTPGSEPRPPTWSYELRLDPTPPGRVDLELSFDVRPGDAEGGGVFLNLPERTSFTALEAPHLADLPLAVDGSGAPVPLERRSPFQWELLPTAPGPVEVRWAITLDHRSLGAIPARDAYGWPYLDEDHGMLVAGTMFLVPEGTPESGIRVRVELPEGWEFLAPWARDPEGGFRPGGVQDLMDEVIGVGQLDHHRIQIDGAEGEPPRFVGTIAFAPGQEQLAEISVPILRDVVEHEIELFGGPPRPGYLFLFGRPDAPGFGGSPKSGSMTLNVNRDLPTAILPSYVGHLCAHEFHHTFARARFRTRDELRFYNEGFTDYAAYVVMGRIGVVDTQGFADSLASLFSDYLEFASSTPRSMVDAGGPDFFTDKACNRIVYLGGAVVAALVDRELRATGEDKSLDAFLAQYVADPERMDEDPEEGVALGPFLDSLERYGDRTLRDRVHGWIHRTEPIELVEEFARTGATLTLVERRGRTPRVRLEGEPWAAIVARSTAPR